jgi:hypothetical protein
VLCSYGGLHVGDGEGENWLGGITDRRDGMPILACRTTEPLENE